MSSLRCGRRRELTSLARAESGGNFIHATGYCPALAFTAASTTFSEEVVGRWWHSRATFIDGLGDAAGGSLGERKRIGRCFRVRSGEAP